jgi:predicted tellurium resistance membrane protein TerC
LWSGFSVGSALSEFSFLLAATLLERLDVEWLTDPQMWIAFVTLTVLEIVLGIDNIIFISIVAGKLPAKQQPGARRLGLLLAVVMRLLLLASVFHLTRLTSPLFTLFAHGFSWRDLILIAGGLFLLAKSTFEIHSAVEAGGHTRTARASSYASVIVQILILDLIFSLDSVITAIGMAESIAVMAAAVIVAVAFMMLFAGPVSDFVHRHPTVKMLALSFLLLIGMALVADGLGLHIPKGYIYFAMGFSVFVEMLNIKLRGRNTKKAGE